MDLNRAIDGWCRKVHPRGVQHEEQIAELSDHLHCEIEALLACGHDQREAFALATERMGAPAELADEHRKNGSLLARMCRTVQEADSALMVPIRRHLSPKAASAVLLAVSLFAAGLMLLSGWLLPDFVNATYLILAAWFVPFHLLSVRSGEKAPTEGSAGA